MYQSKTTFYYFFLFIAKFLIKHFFQRKFLHIIDICVSELNVLKYYRSVVLSHRFTLFYFSPVGNLQCFLFKVKLKSIAASLIQLLISEVFYIIDLHAHTADQFQQKIPIFMSVQLMILFKHIFKLKTVLLNLLTGSYSQHDPYNAF